jgi:alkylation response protein AidB-like acyl-CoA dehydrogenase
MDIPFTEEQELLRNSVQRLLRDHYDFEARRKIVATEGGWSRAQWDGFAEMGLLAAPLPEEFGGLGQRSLAVMIIMQAFGRSLVVEPFFETVVLAAGLIDDVGSAAQREEFLPGIAEGKTIWALA